MATQSDIRRIIAVEDFLGFTYNGQHSKNFGIVRVSSGNRLKEELPEIVDITQNIEGSDGLLYYGSNYKKRDFTINYAFDGMTAEQKSALQKWLGDGEIHDLEFDERPGVKYQAKVTGKAVLNYIPFEDKEKTIYKGEGTIVFTCYYPFGRQRVEASGSTTYTFDGGDRRMYPKINFNKLASELTIHKASSNGTLLMRVDTSIGKAFTIDCEKFLIYDTDGEIYNSAIKGGDFFSVSPGDALYFSTSPSKIVYDQIYY